MKKKLILSIILFLIILLLSGCQFYSLEENETGASVELLGLVQQNNIAKENQEEEYDIPVNGPASAYSVPLIDGLHITGTPIEIDINDFRLEVVGEVGNPLSLTFDQVKEMDHIRIYAELECPGFFIDKGYWTGVEIKDLLKLAEVKDNAENVEFISYDDSYVKSVSIDDVFSSEGLLVAYYFEDNEFSNVHGYPLRIVAKGEIGAVWVKWLGKIEVLPAQEN